MTTYTTFGNANNPLGGSAPFRVFYPYVPSLADYQVAKANQDISTGSTPAVGALESVAFANSGITAGSFPAANTVHYQTFLNASASSSRDAQTVGAYENYQADAAATLSAFNSAVSAGKATPDQVAWLAQYNAWLAIAKPAGLAT